VTRTFERRPRDAAHVVAMQPIRRVLARLALGSRSDRGAAMATLIWLLMSSMIAALVVAGYIQRTTADMVTAQQAKARSAVGQLSANLLGLVNAQYPTAWESLDASQLAAASGYLGDAPAQQASAFLTYLALNDETGVITANIQGQTTGGLIAPVTASLKLVPTGAGVFQGTDARGRPTWIYADDDLDNLALWGPAPDGLQFINDSGDYTVAAPTQAPTIAINPGTNGAVTIQVGTVPCSYGGRAEYQTRTSEDGVAWSDWSTWSQSVAYPSTVDEGASRYAQARARCVSVLGTSTESDPSATAAYTRPISSVVPGPAIVIDATGLVTLTPTGACPAGLTQQVSVQTAVDGGAWSAWATWGTTLTAQILTAQVHQGARLDAQARARCISSVAEGTASSASTGTFTVPISSAPGAPTIAITDGTDGSASWTITPSATACPAGTTRELAWRTAVNAGVAGLAASSAPWSGWGTVLTGGFAVDPGQGAYAGAQAKARCTTAYTQGGEVAGTVATRVLVVTTAPAVPQITLGAFSSYTASTFGRIAGLAYGPDGTLYFAESNTTGSGAGRIRVITPDGAVGVLTGTGAPAGASTTLMSDPRAIALGPDGNLYVADLTANKILKVTPAGVVTVFAGSGTAGHVNGTGTGAQLNNPHGLTFDAAGNLWVVEYANGTVGQSQLTKITPAGVVTQWYTFQGLFVYVAYNPNDGKLYAVDRLRASIMKLDPAVSGGASSLGYIAGPGTNGTVGTANGTGTAARFNEPRGITFDPATGTLLVADSGNNSIRRVTTAGVVTTVATSAGVAPQTVAIRPDGRYVTGSWTNDVLTATDPATGASERLAGTAVTTPPTTAGASSGNQGMSGTFSVSPVAADGSAGACPVGTAPQYQESHTISPGIVSSPSAWSATPPANVTTVARESETVSVMLSARCVGWAKSNGIAGAAEGPADTQVRTAIRPITATPTVAIAAGVAGAATWSVSNCPPGTTPTYAYSTRLDKATDGTWSLRSGYGTVVGLNITTGEDQRGSYDVLARCTGNGLEGPDSANATLSVIRLVNAPTGVSGDPGSSGNGYVASAYGACSSGTRWNYMQMSNGSQGTWASGWTTATTWYRGGVNNESTLYSISEFCRGRFGDSSQVGWGVYW